MAMHQAFLMDMQAAFALNRAGILTLFKDIRDRLDDYGVINNNLTRASFPSVVQGIEALQNVIVYPVRAALTVNYQGTNFELKTLFDLVGWIFSVTGQIPEDATAANYYYPLVILYCQWCRTLCANEEKEPQMVQITWFIQGLEGTKRVCIGSALDRPGPGRKNAARINRFEKLLQYELAEEGERHESYVGDGGQLIGHCAETFPVLFIHSLGNQVALADVRGVAVKPFSALNDRLPNKFHIPNTVVLRDELLADPCRNCKVVLPRLGNDLNLDNFSVLNL
ncbi:hypothetical protein BDR03DRAFT_999527 [Suillus americanus]|nr:hypothetical protein BDR03DRAFT_999527 [Suillus americanus]